MSTSPLLLEDPRYEQLKANFTMTNSNDDDMLDYTDQRKLNGNYSGNSRSTSSSTAHSETDSNSNCGEETSKREPFLEVSTKFESYYSCLDCNTNFLSKERYNDHLEYCGTPQFFYGTSNYAPSRLLLDLEHLHRNEVKSAANVSRSSRRSKQQEKEPQQSKRRSKKLPPQQQQPKRKSPPPPSKVLIQQQQQSKGKILKTPTPPLSPSIVIDKEIIPETTIVNSTEIPVTTTSATINSISTTSTTAESPCFIIEITNNSNNEISKNYNNNNIDMMTLIKTEAGVEIYECKVCNKQYNTRYGFKLHSRTHTGERRYSCPICDKKFTQSGHLRDHSRIHTGEKPFICNIAGCGRRFAQNQNLKHHLRQHDGNRPWICKDCEKSGVTKSFFTKCELTSHSRHHSGNRPFKCKLCQKLFANSKNLKTHISNHHPDMQHVWNYYDAHQCSSCGEIFPDERSLKEHARFGTVVDGSGPLSPSVKLEDDNEMIEVQDVIEVVVESI